MFKEPFSFNVAFIQRKKQKQKKKRIESWSKCLSAYLLKNGRIYCLPIVRNEKVIFFESKQYLLKEISLN
jgi:hypothetical protein